ncbi:MAG: hypothetical protein KDA78_21805, partial [Planctomycetaceae bacterium]|nr:hypothetical protein [Planctomycetaceae bacterium]
ATRGHLKSNLICVDTIAQKEGEVPNRGTPRLERSGMMGVVASVSCPIECLQPIHHAHPLRS